ncbi:MAG TPA: hypothetical protein VEK07_06040 [Polyangiaceae bacterium]|nr:hypothetical protein [Polyangiaceae bacterium]
MATATLVSADRAWDALVQGVGLPPPIGPDEGRWELYLVQHVDGGPSDAFLAGREPVSSFDRGSSFGVLDRLTPPGCALDSSIAYAIARASLWRSVPATDEGSARGEAETFARLVTACAGEDDDVRAFQSGAAQCIVDPSSAPFGRGSSLFFRWLDEKFGARPGALVMGLAALSPTTTGAETWSAGRWAGAPTAFDVLRVSLRDALWRGSTLDDVFVEFAVARALTSSGPTPPVAWRIPWPERPRRLASPEPVAPTGASYIVVDCARAPAAARLRLEMEWEDYARMRWIAVKLDASGREIARLPVGSLDRSTHASMTIATLDGVDHVLVVGVNVGDTERAFHPDDQRWEPHGWLLTVAGE